MTIEHNVYTNPVFARSSPDPFVLKHCGEYWAYCTGIWHDGRCFGVLHSRDLVHWRDVGGALEPLPDGWPEYWAPEVVYHNGLFYMYYSVGDEAHMEIRVGIADYPAGPFADSGRRLTDAEFAIDAHVFVDEGGERYLFYATDFLEHTHIGTGTVVDRLLDPLTLAGDPHPVSRARYPWQIYDPQRPEKGGVRWHTVEGSFVVQHRGRYYQMFSGGNWQNPTYGVSYAVSDTLDRADEWEQHADGANVLPILRTLPGQVIGPGHNSVVRGPDNRQLFCVYHRWALDGSARMMAIDRLDFVGDRMIVLGPSTTPQPVPTQPHAIGFEGWRAEGGDWVVDGDVARQRTKRDPARLTRDLPASSWLIEVSVEVHERGGSYGVELGSGNKASLRCTIEPGRCRVLVAWRDQNAWQERAFDLPNDWACDTFHDLRLACDGRRVSVALDDRLARHTVTLPTSPDRLSLVTSGTTATFGGFALTLGFETWFDDQHDLAAEGWSAIGDGAWRLTDRELICEPRDDQPAVIVKHDPFDRYELVVNLRLVDEAGRIGFYPAWRADDPGPLLVIERRGAGWALRCRDADRGDEWPLPAPFDPLIHQQFRCRRLEDRVLVGWEAHELGTIPVAPGPTHVALWAQHAPAAFDLLRVTAL
jgi:GH43 family beta-xylosidase